MNPHRPDRLRDWVSICGTGIDRDPSTRQTTCPGETPSDRGSETEIRHRHKDFAEFVREDVLRRQRTEVLASKQLIG